MTQHPFKQFLAQLLPFLFLGVAFALLIGIFIMLSYVLFWGLIIGVVLWIVARIKLALMHHKTQPTKPISKTGRIIEHDDDAKF
jgi:hypothetical protein